CRPMESYELASHGTGFGGSAFFVQRPRHLLPDRRKEQLKRSNKSQLRSRDAHSNRQRIVEAAPAHIFSQGFRSGTMDDLAEELGISKKTIYAHFPGKFDLLEAVLSDKFASVEKKASPSFSRLS